MALARPHESELFSHWVKSTIFIAASISWPTAFKSPFRRLLPLCGRSEVKSRDPRQSSPCTIRHGEYSFGNQVLCAAKTSKIKNLCGLCVYAGHDTSSGVKVSNEPVRRNQIVEDKFAPAREWMKEVQDETRRTRTGNGYKAYLRASRHYTTKPQP